MIALSIFIAGLLVALGGGVLAAWSDVKGLTIPNVYSAIIMIAFFVCYGLLWVLGQVGVFDSFLMHLLGGLLVFGITAPLFVFGLMGAADSKLATVFAFWVGLWGSFPFLVYTTIAGGLVALLTLLIQKYKPFTAPLKEGWVDRTQRGEGKVPYGVAIVVGALASFVFLGYTDLNVLRSFL